jgi:hypothetical protein
MLAAAHRGSRIVAVSVLDDSEWRSTPAEVRYLEANVEAAKRGARIERVFVIKGQDSLLDRVNREVIAEHVKHAGDGLIAYVVWHEELRRLDAEVMQNTGAGFVSFDQHVALVDTRTQPSETKGIVTMSTPQLRQMERVFSKLKLHSQRADQQFLEALDKRRTDTTPA